MGLQLGVFESMARAYGLHDSRNELDRNQQHGKADDQPILLGYATPAHNGRANNANNGHPCREQKELLQAELKPSAHGFIISLTDCAVISQRRMLPWRAN